MARPTLPDPVWLAYQGPGDVHLVRFTLGPYRVMCEAPRDVPIAVPPDTADQLVARGFEVLDEDEAIEAIVARDRQLADDEAAWLAEQERLRQRHRDATALRQLAVDKALVMRAALADQRARGASSAVRLAAANEAGARFESEIRAWGAALVEADR